MDEIPTEPMKAIVWHNTQLKFHMDELHRLRTQNKDTLLTLFQRDIMKEVCDRHSIGEFEILQETRRKEIIDARREFIKIMRDNFNMSYTHLGKIFNRNHASIIYLYNT